MGISLDGISSYIDTTKATSANSELQKTLGSDLSTATDDELMDVCKEFETYFIEQVMKEVEKTIPNSDKDSSMSQLTGFYKDKMVQDLAGQVGGQTGNSLAQTMYEQMKRNYGL